MTNVFVFVLSGFCAILFFCSGYLYYRVNDIRSDIRSILNKINDLESSRPPSFPPVRMIEVAEPTTGILNRVSVLIVDDEKTNIAVLQAFLQCCGLNRYAVAQSGWEAVSYCNDEKFGLIFMDIQMPDLNGIKATEKILRESTKNREAVIVPLTGSSRVVSGELCRKYGMIGFLEKPVTLGKLIALLRRLVDNDGSVRAASYLRKAA